MFWMKEAFEVNMQKRWFSLLLALTLLLGCVPAMSDTAEEANAQPALKTVINGNWEYPAEDFETVLKYLGHDAYVTVPDGVKRIGANCFLDNLDLETVDLNAATVIQANAFSGCKNLETVINLKKVTQLGEGAFFNCRKLEEITLSTKLEAIEARAFQDCISLSKINYKDGVNHIPDSVAYISNYAFSTCINLTNVSVPSEVQHIGDYAFHSCTELLRVRISGTVTTVGVQGFGNCPKLVIECYKGSAAEAYAIANGIEYISIIPLIDTITINDGVTVIKTDTYTGTASLWKVITPEVSANSEVGWTTSNPGIALVDQNGVVTAVKAGSYATIKCTSTDANHAISNNCYAFVVDTSGWQVIKGYHFYCTSTADQLMNVFRVIDEKLYHFNAAGYRDEGVFVSEMGATYYFVKDFGYAAKGWQDIKVNKVKQRFYFDEDYKMAVGWKEIDGYWYYFGTTEDDHGFLKTGWQEIDGKTYYLADAASGASGKKVGRRLTGWNRLTLNGAKYWFNFDDNGAMRTGWYKENRKSFYLRANGSMVEEWYKIKNNWYYFHPQTKSSDAPPATAGYMYTGAHVINGKKQSFGSNGVWKGKGNPPVTPQKVELSKINLNLTIGKSSTINVELTPDYAVSTIAQTSWPTVSKSGVVSITRKGDKKFKVTAVGAGTTTIRFTVARGVYAECTVIVTGSLPLPTYVKILGGSKKTLNVGDYLEYKSDSTHLKYKPASGIDFSNIKWHTSDPSILKMTKKANGVIRFTAVDVGEAEIYVTFGEHGELESTNRIKVKVK